MLPQMVDADRIREAVLSLLADGPDRVRAKSLGVDIRRNDGALVAADVLADFAARARRTRV